MSSCLAIPKIRSIEFVRQMFLDRGYVLQSEDRMFDTQQNMWQLVGQTAQGDKVMALFADCKPFGDSLEMEEFVSTRDLVSDSMVAVEKGKAHSQNAGTDLVKNITSMARAQQIKVLILVSDFITPKALKHIISLQDIRFTHFTYAETGIENMARHIAQPVVFRPLSPSERARFVQTYPRYHIELPRYSIDDPLVKYFGLQVGDLVYIEDNDRQTGLVIEHGQVVENL